MLIENTIIHIGDGSIIKRGYVGFNDGKINYVGEAKPSKSIPNSYESFLIFNIDDLNIFKNNFKKLVEYKNYSIQKFDLSFLEFVNQIALVKNNSENLIIFHTFNQNISNKLPIDETKEFNYRNVKFFELSKTPSLNFMKKVLFGYLPLKMKNCFF